MKANNWQSIESLAVLESKVILLLASASGVIAVIVGAIGAHGVEFSSPELRSAFATGVSYHWYHTLALLALGILKEKSPQQNKVSNQWLAVSTWLMVAGVLLFCGSLYAMPFVAWSWLGPVTPIGGLSLVFSWLAFFISIWHRSCRTMSP